MLSRRLLPVPFVLLALAVSGCGDDKNATEVSEATSTAATTATEATTSTSDGKAPSVDEIAKGIGTDLDKAPEFIAMSGTPPTELIQEDIVEGDGKEAKEGDTLQVHYVGASWSTGEEFDASWTDGQPIPLSLMQVIAGWQQGIPGMKEGGQRQLIIPPDLAYGDTPPQGSTIAAGETLVFIIGLVKIGE
jgi:peptidylprolyl isomerase